MAMTIKGTLHGADTRDNCEIFRPVRKYRYTCKATGGGNLRLKIKCHDGAWRTLVDRERIHSGATVTGTFTAPLDPVGDGKSHLKIVFSRGGVATGVTYDYRMEPA